MTPHRHTDTPSRAAANTSFGTERHICTFSFTHTLTHIHTRMHHSCGLHNTQPECRVETRHSAAMRQSQRRCQIPVTSGKAGGPTSPVLHMGTPPPKKKTPSQIPTYEWNHQCLPPSPRQTFGTCTGMCCVETTHIHAAITSAQAPRSCLCFA